MGKQICSGIARQNNLDYPDKADLFLWFLPFSFIDCIHRLRISI